MDAARKGRKRGPVAAKSARLTLAAAALAAVAACTSAEPGAYPEPPEFRAAAKQTTATLFVPPPGADGDFAPADRARAAAFLDAYREGGRGPLTAAIAAPTARAAAATEAALRLLARKRGIAADALRIPARSPAGTPAGVTLTYAAFTASAPACSPEIVLSRNPTAEVSPNLGCALEQGVAAIIANPADLTGPAAEAPGDGARLGRAVDLYRQGKATQAEANRNDDAKSSSTTVSIGK